ncbi:MAG TPA: TonB family protein [Candidatus Acidoferrum sp.]|nr:TonB family protein [Candidatus Acidoferrum sp.]
MLGSSHILAIANCRRSESSFGFALLLLWMGFFCLPAQAGADNTPSHSSVDRTGELRVAANMTLRLNADLGNVRIQTLPPDAPPILKYTVHIETDAPGQIGQKMLSAYSLTTHETVDTVVLTGAVANSNSLPPNIRVSSRNFQVYVQFVVTVPAAFSVDVSTGLGDIETADLGGRVSLSTQGGNITAGRIGMAGPPLARGERPLAKIETQGGHITLKDVAGDVDAYTAGGHILAGKIEGNARLHTGGGHIRAAKIGGTARLETEGGNIAVGEAGSVVNVRTTGGQIDFGEVRGSVHAETGGGGIRVISVSGPMEVATSGGSICLTRVANRVHAETGEGTITAWINPQDTERAHVVRMSGPSQLASHTGDIVVFLPRNIALTIDATVENSALGRIEADPTLPLNNQSQPNGPVHMVAALNGGGSLLKLHTTAGKIRLQYQDAQMGLRQSLQDEEKQRLAEKLSEYQATPVSLNTPPELSPAEVDWFDSARKRFEVVFLGGVHEDPKDFSKRLANVPKPEYPALAKNAGVHGLVVLEVRLKTDGTVAIEKVVQGPPMLAEAAITAVQNWRLKPEQVNGKNVEVVSTVSFEFLLH